MEEASTSDRLASLPRNNRRSERPGRITSGRCRLSAPLSLDVAAEHRDQARIGSGHRRPNRLTGLQLAFSPPQTLTVRMVNTSSVIDKAEMTQSTSAKHLVGRIIHETV